MARLLGFPGKFLETHTAGVKLSLRSHGYCDKLTFRSVGGDTCLFPRGSSQS